MQRLINFELYILHYKFIFVYKRILHTLFQWNADQACEHILALYDRKGFCIVDYLYFANIYGKKLFDQYQSSYHLADFQNALLEEYKQKDMSQVRKLYQDAILDADVVLPDGIALQLFYFLSERKRLKNLNGTDFAPCFLQYLGKKYGYDKVRLILYGTYPHLLDKTRKFLEKQWYQVVYAQDGYINLDRNQVEKVLLKKDWTVDVLLVARSTPVYPIQEIRSYANKKKIQQHNLLVMNQWGTFDFWVGDQKRPPMLFRRLKLERLRRLLSDPKRNYKKVMDSLGILPYIFSYLLLKKSAR